MREAGGRQEKVPLRSAKLVQIEFHFLSCMVFLSAAPQSHKMIWQSPPGLPCALRDISKCVGAWWGRSPPLHVDGGSGWAWVRLPQNTITVYFVVFTLLPVYDDTDKSPPRSAGIRPWCSPPHPILARESRVMAVPENRTCFRKY